MLTAQFSSHGPLESPQENALVGLTDIELVTVADQTKLFVTSRADGWLTGYDVGGQPGATQHQQSWFLPSEFLQLESTDLVVQYSGNDAYLHLSGLRDDALQSLQISPNGPLLQSAGSHQVGQFDLGQISEMEITSDGQRGLAGLRGGGLVNVSFGAGGILSLSNLNQGNTFANASASEVMTTQHNGETYAFASYGAENAISVFQQANNGDFQHLGDASIDTGLAINTPGAMTIAQSSDGEKYVILASSGSSSLTVLNIPQNGGAFTPVDHVIDDLNTRFAHASHIDSVTISGQDFIIAGGSDSGLSLFALLPEGQLQHISSMAGQGQTPLNGLTGIQAMATQDGIRIWATTDSAPYVSEFSIDLGQFGGSQITGANGGNLSGTGQDDILSGRAGNDQLTAQDGNDILSDGAGADVLTGGSGADLFVMTADDTRDVITDFEFDRDTIDLSDLGPAIGLSAINLQSHSWGATLRYQTEELEVRSADGTSLNASHFSSSNVILGNALTSHMSQSPTQIGGTNPSEPNPDPIADSTNPDFPQDPELSAPSWIDPPFAADQPSSELHIGSNRNDALLGGDGADIMSGGDGRDSIWGGNGSDEIIGGDGHDWISAGNNFGLKADKAWGEDGKDTIFGGDGIDLLSGGDDHDVVIGGGGADNLYGDAGNDTVIGGSGKDRLFGGNGNDQLSGGNGADHIFGQNDNDTIWGGQGQDLIVGGAGDDLLMGGDGDDTLQGGSGEDTIDGGQGDDMISGGVTADEFVFLAGHGHDTVSDFDAMYPTDVLNVSSFGTFNTIVDVMNAATQDGFDTVIRTSNDSSIRLTNVDLGDLDGSDFTF